MLLQTTNNCVATASLVPHLVVAEKGVSERPRHPLNSKGDRVVATLSGNKERVPGGRETLREGIAEGRDGRPVLEIRNVRLVVNTDIRVDLYNKVLDAAEELRRMFHEDSLATLTQSRITGPRTLVTVVRYPIHVRVKGSDLTPERIRWLLENKPEFYDGFEARCSFVQVVRPGSVDPGTFEVRSWEGEMPLTLPREQDLFRIVDIHSHIAGAKAFMDRAEAGEVIHRDYGASAHSSGPRQLPDLGRKVGQDPT